MSALFLQWEAKTVIVYIYVYNHRMSSSIVELRSAELDLKLVFTDYYTLTMYVMYDLECRLHHDRFVLQNIILNKYFVSHLSYLQCAKYTLFLIQINI